MNAGCADSTVFNNMTTSLDWGAPKTAGSWAAHPLEAGLGTAQSNTFNTAIAQWIATASDGTTVGLGAGPGVGTGHATMQRFDNAVLIYDPNSGSQSWDSAGAAPYYSNWSTVDGHANSGPLTAPGMIQTNVTDQFYSGTYSYDHGGPNQVGTSSTAVPYVGDHLVGFLQGDQQNQSMALSFSNGSGGGLDRIAFSIVALSNNQTIGQAAAQANWISGATPKGILDILVQAYDNINPLLGHLLYTYEIEVNGAFGQCSGLSNTAEPVPCKDAPIVAINGTPGLFNIRSIVISSKTDIRGFMIDELYFDQGTTDAVPEPAALFLIGGGLMLMGLVAKRRGIVR